MLGNHVSRFSNKDYTCLRIHRLFISRWRTQSHYGFVPDPFATFVLCLGHFQIAHHPKRLQAP